MVQSCPYCCASALMTIACYLLGWSGYSITLKVWKERGRIGRECGRGCNENRGGPFIELQRRQGIVGVQRMDKERGRNRTKCHQRKKTSSLIRHTYVGFLGRKGVREVSKYLLRKIHRLWIWIDLALGSSYLNLKLWFNLTEPPFSYLENGNNNNIHLKFKYTTYKKMMTFRDMHEFHSKLHFAWKTAK